MLSCPPCPKWAAGTVLRVSFGLSLAFVGLAHLLQYQAFSLMVADALGPVGMLGTVWAYVLPVLMILGGGLFVSGKYGLVASWCSGVALASIPAGMLLKPLMSGIGLEEVMPAATQAFIWLLVYVAVVKSDGCCSGNCEKK